MAGLKNFKRHGSDGLPPDLLRHGERWMAEALRQMFSFFLNHSTHPPSWDVVPSTPLYKSGDRTDPMDYRIIAFQTALCKTFDSCLAARLTQWANTTGLLSNNQYGFRSQTETADLWYTYKHTIESRNRARMYTFVASST